MAVEYKGYVIKSDQTFSMLVIGNSSGPVPDDLKGSFTNRKQAENAIDGYVAKNPPKPKYIPQKERRAKQAARTE